jgi:hypothetical protein
MIFVCLITYSSKILDIYELMLSRRVTIMKFCRGLGRGGGGGWWGGVGWGGGGGGGARGGGGFVPSIVNLLRGRRLW